MWSTRYSTQRPQAAPPGYWYVPVRATAAGSLRTSLLDRNECPANGSFWTAPPAAFAQVTFFHRDTPKDFRVPVKILAMQL